MFKQIVPSTGKISQEDSPKAAFRKYLRKEQNAAPLLERLVYSSLSGESRQKCNGLVIFFK